MTSFDLIRVPRSLPALVLASLAVAPLGAQSALWTKQAPTISSEVRCLQLMSPSEAWGVYATGVIHSTDGGGTWSSIPLPSASLWTLQFFTPDHGYVAGNGFFETTDGGEHWTKVADQGSMDDIFFLDPDHGWACTNGGMVGRTSDGGAAWQWSNVGTQTTLRGLWFTDPQKGFAVSIGSLPEEPAKIFRSLDGGVTWAPVFSGGSNLQHVQFVDAQRGLAMGGSTLLRTTNGGASWQPGSAPAGAWAQEGWMVDAALGFAVGDGAQVLRTTDGGLSWQFVVPPGSGPRLWAVGFAGASTGMYGGELGTLALTQDGGTSWSPAADAACFTVEAIDALDGLRAWTTDTGGRVDRTVDGGITWTPAAVDGFGGFGQVHDLDFADASRGWAVGHDASFSVEYTGVISRSLDGGATWQAQWTEPQSIVESVAALSAQTAVAAGYNLDSGGFVLRTENGGATWTDHAPSLAAFGALSFLDAQRGWLTGGSQTYKTTDGGKSWSLAFAAPQFLEDVDFSDAQHGWVAGWFQTLYRTEDGGAHWDPVQVDFAPWSGVATNDVIFDVEAIDADTAWIFGSEGLAARTDDGGATWDFESLPESDPYWPHQAAFFFDADNGWAGGSGVWRRDAPCGAPAAYGAAKPDSAGHSASLGWSGEPSPAGGFALVVANGLPGAPGQILAGFAGPASIPAAGGTLLVQPPLILSPLLTLDAAGAAQLPVPVAPSFAGVSAWAQFWFLDTALPTALAHTQGLSLAFCE